MQSYCKFLPNSYVLRLIGTVQLVGNIIPVFEKLDIDIYARCKLFWGHYQEKTCVRGCCKHSRDKSSLLQWKQCLWCFTYIVKFSICPFSCIIYLYYLLEVYFILIDILYKLHPLLVGQLTHERILICLIFHHFSAIFAQVTIF